MKLIKAFDLEKNRANVIALIKSCLKYHPSQRSSLILIWARNLIELERPRKALKVLEELVPDGLTQKQAVYYRKLHSFAKQLIANGTLETE